MFSPTNSTAAFGALAKGGLSSWSLELDNRAELSTTWQKEAQRFVHSLCPGRSLCYLPSRKCYQPDLALDAMSRSCESCNGQVLLRGGPARIRTKKQNVCRMPVQLLPSLPRKQAASSNWQLKACNSLLHCCCEARLKPAHPDSRTSVELLIPPTGTYSFELSFPHQTSIVHPKKVQEKSDLTLARQRRDYRSSHSLWETATLSFSVLWTQVTVQGL